jgi:hypothetical protein
MYITRLREIQRKDISPQQLARRSDGQTLLSDSAGPSDNFKNMFEMPMLFFLAVLLSLLLFIQDDLLVDLAWGYVILRVIHSVIHCTYNRVLHRFTVYFTSSLVLALIWLRLGLYILTQ